MRNNRNAGNARTRTIITGILLAAFTGIATDAGGQVSVAPTALFIDSQTRYATFNVRNGSDEVQEVAVEFIFGYPDADSLGRSVLVYDDSLAAAQYSMAPWVRGFPRYFMLAPGQQQVIRLTVRPPHDLPDGMYWMRIKTISNPQGPMIAAGSTETVRAHVNFRLEQVTAGFYKKGRVSTGVEIDDLAVGDVDGALSLLANVRRTGNAPYLGSMLAAVYDAQGNRIREARNQAAIYFDGTRRSSIDLTGLPPGEYTAQVRFETQRNDIPRGDLIQAEPVTRAITFRIP